MDEYVGKICPYCKTEIKEGDEVKVCPECGIPHHAACWEENKGCTTFGCKEQHYEEQHTNPTDVCSNCGAPLGDGQAFCPKCGTPKNAPKKNVCGKCGAELQDGQEFCPHCAQENDLQISEEFSNTIVQFNQNIEKQAKKKKNKIKMLLILLAILVPISAGTIGGYAFFNNKAERVIDKIESSNLSSEETQAAYKELTPIGQLLFREKIVDAFVNTVSDNVYMNTSGYLVNESALEKYSTYEEIGNSLNITDDDGTNVMSHIQAVLKLSYYKQYNDVYRCMSASVDFYKLVLENLSDAAECSYYLFDFYAEWAHKYAESALSYAKESSSGDSLCTKYVNALDTIEQETYYLDCNIYYFSFSNLSPAIDTVGDILSTVSSAVDSVESIVDGIPEIKAADL